VYRVASSSAPLRERIGATGVRLPVVAHEPLAVDVADTGTDPPRWLLLAAVVAASAVFSFGVAGLLLAVNSRYTPTAALVVGAIGLVVLVVVAAPSMPRGDATARAAQVVAWIGVAAIVAIALWNTTNESQHVLMNRDGGVYSELGRWIARDGTLAVRPIGPFKTGAPFSFGFGHLLPVLLAEGFAAAGSRGLFHLPSVLGGVALLEFFVLAWRVMRRPWFALAATLALALCIPQVSFARDSYSEIPSQILLFAALALMVDRRGLPHWRRALVAGLFLGATQATRIDAMAFFIGVPALIAVAWLREQDRSSRRALAAPAGAFVLGLGPGIALGLVDLMHHSGDYWTRLWHDERTLIALVVASTVVSVAVVLAWRRLLPVVRALPWNGLSWLAAAGVVIAGAAAWFVRPRVLRTHGHTLVVIQASNHLAYTAVRNDYERSMIWMSWYLGPLTVAAAIVGAALLTRALIRGGLAHVVAPLAILLPGGLLYLWSASAQPDHIWVTRRFLVGAIPMLILLALGLAAWLWTAGGLGRWTRAARAGGLVITVVAVAFPVATLVPVASMREQAGYLSVIDDACHDMGASSAAVVLEPPLRQRAFLEQWATQALTGWCGTRVVLGRFGFESPASILGLARQWQHDGRRLFVVAAVPSAIHDRFPTAQIVATRRATNTHLLSTTITHRPRGYQSQTFQLFIAAVPSAA
jgi:hypothetical protein